MKETILITGGTGSIGPAIVKKLHEAGYKVVVFAKDGFKSNDIPKGISLCIGDIRNFSFFKIGVDIDIVIHMAGLTPGYGPNEPSPGEYEDVNVKATRNLVEQAKRLNVKRIIFFSTINVYGNNRREILNEESVPEPIDLYGETKLRAEQIILNAKNKAGNFIGTALRIATVYGPEMKGNYSNLVKLIYRNRFLPVGKGINRKTLIYVRDLAQAIEKVIENKPTVGQIYNVTDGNIYLMKDILNAIYSALGKKRPNYYLPVNLFRFSLNIYNKSLSLIGKKPTFGDWLLDKYTEDVAVSGDKFIRETGFNPVYSLKDGWIETVRGMRSRGLISHSIT